MFAFAADALQAVVIRCKSSLDTTDWIWPSISLARDDASAFPFLWTQIWSLTNALEAFSHTVLALNVGVGGLSRRPLGMMLLSLHLIRKVRLLECLTCFFSVFSSVLNRVLTTGPYRESSSCLRVVLGCVKLDDVKFLVLQQPSSVRLYLRFDRLNLRSSSGSPLEGRLGGGV